MGAGSKKLLKILVSKRLTQAIKTKKLIIPKALDLIEKLKSIILDDQRVKYNLKKSDKAVTNDNNKKVVNKFLSKTYAKRDVKEVTRASF